MSSFDDALRREEAKQRSSDAAQQSEQNRRLSAAGAVTDHITRLLQEFCQRLAERGVKPERVEIAQRRGLLHPAKYSPEGYITGTSFYSNRRQSLHLVTPDGKLFWWSSAHPDRAGFVPITAENVARGNVWIGGDYRITSGSGGKAQVYRNGDPPTETPLEDWLAACAVRLIRERSMRR